MQNIISHDNRNCRAITPGKILAKIIDKFIHIILI